MRTSASSRASDDTSIVSTARRKGFMWSRRMPGNEERARLISDSALRDITNLPSRQRTLSGGHDAAFENNLSPSPTGVIHSRSFAFKRHSERAARPQAAIDSNKPYPPLPRRTEPSRVSLPARLIKMSVGRAAGLGRKRSQSLPSPRSATTTHRSSLTDTARPQIFKRLPSTPSLTHLDGSVESNSTPQTPCNRHRFPPRVHARAKSAAVMPLLPHHPMTDFSRHTTLDDLYDSYFDAQFKGESDF